MRCYPYSFLYEKAEKIEKINISSPMNALVMQILKHISKSKKMSEATMFEEFGLDFTTLRHGNIFNIFSYIR